MCVCVCVVLNGVGPHLFAFRTRDNFLVPSCCKKVHVQVPKVSACDAQPTNTVAEEGTKKNDDDDDDEQEEEEEEGEGEGAKYEEEEELVRGVF